MPAVAPYPSSSAVIPLNLLNSDNSKVTVALAWIVPVFGNICTEFRRKGLPNLFHSDSSVDDTALIKPEYVIMYFISLQVPNSIPFAIIIMFLDWKTWGK